MKIKLPAVLLFLCFFVKAQVTFQKTYGGSGSDYADAVQQTRDGGYIIAGASESFSHDQDFEIYLIKTDSNGNIEWTRLFSDSVRFLGMSKSSVQQTADGGYIVTSSIHDAAFLIRTDPNGDTVWTRKYRDFTYGTTVKQTKDGGYIMGGHMFHSLPQLYDALLIKTDAAGDTLWTRRFGSTVEEESYAVTETKDGGYVIAGLTYSYNAGTKDAFIAKTSVSGDLLWAKTFGGSLGYDVATSIQETNDGGLIMAGETQDFAAGLVMIFLVKTDENGKLTWSKSYKRYHFQRANSVQQTPDGGYIVAGDITTDSTAASGKSEAFLMKTDSNGNVQWTRIYGAGDWEGGNSVDQTSDGGFVLAGSVFSYGAGSGDVFLIKTDAAGNSGCNDNSFFVTVYSKVTDTATMLTGESPGMTYQGIPTHSGKGGTATIVCLNVGTSEAIDKNDIVVYPNPGNGVFRLMIPPGERKEISIYNVVGNRIFNKPIEGEEEIDLSAHAGGVYFLRIEDKGGSVSVRKIIVGN